MSKICTDIEQSKKLLEMGIDPDTANMSCNEDYVSFEVAKLLKEKGFDETCYACYEYFSSSITVYSGWPFEYKGKVVNNSKDRIKCPTLQMAMKWLREMHRICIITMPVVTDDDGEAGCLWKYVISRKLEVLYNSEYLYESSDIASNDAIKYCLENLI